MLPVLIDRSREFQKINVHNSLIRFILEEVGCYYGASACMLQFLPAGPNTIASQGYANQWYKQLLQL